jgi:uncharacterized phage-associated protein
MVMGKVAGMASIFDVAKYILTKQNAVSTWKLQKLCYYSQAWALAWTGEPLFNEDFEAWTNGPVSRPLFDAHQGVYSLSAETFTPGNIDNLNDDEKDTINTVLGFYGEKTPFWLREQTHDELPWKTARGDLPEESRSTAIITKTSMHNYYGSL